MANIAISDIQTLSTNIEGEDLFLISKKNLVNNTYNSAKIKASDVLESVRALDWEDSRSQQSLRTQVFNLNGVNKTIEDPNSTYKLDYDNLDLSSSTIDFDEWVVPYSGLLYCHFTNRLLIPMDVYNASDTVNYNHQMTFKIVDTNIDILHWHTRFIRSSSYNHIEMDMVDCNVKTIQVEKNQRIQFTLWGGTQVEANKNCFEFSYLNRIYLIPYKHS